MIRKIIHIDEEKCNGCGLCAEACHEGAIEMVNGKARLMRDDYCDGLGDCLPACPTGAITFTEREAAAYDEEAVIRHLAKRDGAPSASGTAASQPGLAPQPSQLCQWPVQIKLVPVKAPYFAGARLLIAADCTAYAYGAFHEEFMKDRITLIGCPKMAGVYYSVKLTELLKHNELQSICRVRMEVPCCGGSQHAATQALKDSGKFIPWQVVTISTDGRILA